MAKKDYQNFAHGGSGRSQGIGPIASGADPRGKLRNSEAMPHRGQGAPKGGYDTEAHSTVHHGKRGQAAGHRTEAKPMGYTAKVQSEGAKRPGSQAPDGGPTRVGSHDHAESLGSGATANKLIHGSTKAHHHPSASHTPHVFNGVNSVTGQAHGFGHPSSLKKGALRMSGHSRAHRVGGK